MGVNVKAEWLETYKSAQHQKRETERGKRVDRFLLIAFAVSSIGAIVLTYLTA